MANLGPFLLCITESKYVQESVYFPLQKPSAEADQKEKIKREKVPNWREKKENKTVSPKPEACLKEHTTLNLPVQVDAERPILQSLYLKPSRSYSSYGTELTVHALIRQVWKVDQQV